MRFVAILGVEGNLGLVSIDDWRHGEHRSLRVVNHRVNRTVPDNTKVLLQVAVALEHNKREREESFKRGKSL